MASPSNYEKLHAMVLCYCTNVSLFPFGEQIQTAMTT